MGLLECVPNLSEGRSDRTLDALAAAAEEPGVYILDRSRDADHHRAVITLAGERAAKERLMVMLSDQIVNRLYATTGPAT